MNWSQQQEKTAAREGKHSRSVVFGKRNVFTFEAGSESPERVSNIQRERARSFLVERPKTWEPTVESVVQGIWRLRGLHQNPFVYF